MVGKRKVSIFSVLVFIVGLSGLGLGAYSLYNYNQHVNQVEVPKPLARAFVSTSISIPSSILTVVNFDVVDYDVTGDFNIITDRFICPTSGYYYISGKVKFTIMLDAEAIYVGLYREGVIVAENSADASHTLSLSTSFTDIVYLNAGDYVEVKVYHTGSSARSIYGDTEGTYTYLTIAATDILN